MKVRNKVLYDFLSYYYGKVKVANQGNPYRYRVIYEQGIKKLDRVEGGEQYSVCCPHCKDTRFRLNVGYVFGSTIEGVTMWHTAFCFNCESANVVTQLKQQYMEFQLFYDGTNTTSVVTAEQTENMSLLDIAKESAGRMVQFEGMTPINKLPADHPAVQYMIKRGLDPRYYGERLSICYLYNEKREARFAHRRLVIPMFFYNHLVAWQARVITGHTVLTSALARKAKWPYMEPKYWTAAGAKRGLFLYNYDIARHYPFCVLCEGAFDAWKIGPQAVGIWGRRLSKRQAELIATTWPQAVLFGDPGFDEDWLGNQRILNDAYRSTHYTKLYVPQDIDAGDMSYDCVWERLASVGVCPAVAAGV
jgi:hypothetical protein